MTIIAGDFFSAFKAAGVDDEVAKRAAAEDADIWPQGVCIKDGVEGEMVVRTPRLELPHSSATQV